MKYGRLIPEFPRSAQVPSLREPASPGYLSSRSIYGMGYSVGLLFWIVDGIKASILFPDGVTRFWTAFFFGHDQRDLYLRVLTVLIILASTRIVAGLLRRRNALNARLFRINRLLAAARDISMLIAKEKDPARLLQAVSGILVDRGGCAAVTIVDQRSEESPNIIYHAGTQIDADSLRQALTQGYVPPCISGAEAEARDDSPEDRGRLCEPCRLVTSCDGRVGMALRIPQEETPFGWLMVSTLQDLARDAEHYTILKNIVSELGWALGSIEAERLLKRERRIVDAILRGTAQSAGTAFFRELGASLCELFHVKYAIAAEIMPGNRARTVVVAIDGELADNFEYDLDGTPCADVKLGETCLYPSGVQHRFPNDALLAEIGAESYLGTPLCDPSGKTHGLLAVLDDKPMEDGDRLPALLEVFAARAGAELGRRDAVKALSGSERRYQELLEKTSEGFWLIDSGQNTVQVNDALCSMLGYAPDEMIGKSPLEFSYQEGKEKLADHLSKIHHTTNLSCEVRFKKKTGVPCTVILHGTSLFNDTGDFEGAFALVTDITERKAMEEELRLSESRYHQMFETNKAVKLIIDSRDGHIVDANESALSLYGYSREEMAALKISDINTLSWAEIQQEMAAAVREERTYFEFRHKLASGEVRDVEVYSGPLTTPDSVLLYSIVHDITARKKVERERERLMQAISQAAEAFVITDRDGTIQYVNPAFEQVTGYTPAEVLGQNPRILRSGQHDDAFYAAMWDTLKSGETWSGRIWNKRKDGTLFLEDVVLSPVRDSSGNTVNYVGVKRDVTQEFHLENQLVQAQKLESVGRLAGGVAHDFNNMLAVILGNAELALGEPDLSARSREAIFEIQKAARRSADLTRQLLAFARRQPIAPRILDMNASINGMLTMLIRLIGEDIKLNWTPTPDLWHIRIDPGQVDQIILNLCVNARDAILSHGTISIKACNSTIDEAFCREHMGASPGDHVHIAVSDSGHGMSKETLANIFEPFFTTKSEAEGTGLGLATTYGIVKQNKGYIDVCSELGRGSTFNIFLPRHVGPETPFSRKPRDDRDLQGRETILVVEDEPAILRMSVIILKKLGYVVLAAGSPADAINVVKRRSAEIDLLVSDVIMPDMNGYELADRIVPLCPGIKRLFVSGYTTDVAPSGDADSSTAFLQKPYAGKELATKVRDLLDAAAQPTDHVK